MKLRLIHRHCWLLGLVIFLLFLGAPGLFAGTDGAADPHVPELSFSEGVRSAMMEEASRVSEELQGRTLSLFARRPLGWNLDTLDYIYNWGVHLPLKVPEILEDIREQSRLLGMAGSLFVLVLLLAVVYSLFWQKHVLAIVEKNVRILKEWIPEGFFPFVLSLSRVVVASLVPLILLGAFSLVFAFVAYKASWFLFIKEFLILWTIGALLINLLREVLVRDLFPLTQRYGNTLFQISRLIILFILSSLAVIWGTKALGIRGDVQAFIRFVVSLSIVCSLIPLLLKKQALLSLLPELPYRSYETFTRILGRYYFPVIFFTFLTGLLWCFGYRQFSRILWIRTWAVGGSFILIMLSYHLLNGRLKAWVAKHETEDEEARFLFGSLRSILLYATVVATALVTVRLLGLSGPIERVLSFPFLHVGGAAISVWLLTRAFIILLAFLYATRLVQAYLNYKVYPAIGIDTGLAYVLNIFLKYLGVAVGVLFFLGIVGIDLRIFLVFAGAIGIGIGMGLQNMASNLISGFSLVFGRKLRKDDWIQVGDTRGVVTDIFLRATKVKTRDNVEYLIPNSDFINKPFVNYTLSSPTIRIHIPVHVSYQSDPERVQGILLEEAQNHPEVLEYRPPEVSFVEYASSAIVFELLVWVDIRQISEWRIRSRLYFDIFNRFRREGIKIPYPQREIYIRSENTAPDPESSGKE